VENGITCLEKSKDQLVCSVREPIVGIIGKIYFGNEITNLIFDSIQISSSSGGIPIEKFIFRKIIKYFGNNNLMEHAYVKKYFQNLPNWFNSGVKFICVEDTLQFIEETKNITYENFISNPVEYNNAIFKPRETIKQDGTGFLESLNSVEYRIFNYQSKFFDRVRNDFFSYGVDSTSYDSMFCKKKKRKREEDNENEENLSKKRRLNSDGYEVQEKLLNNWEELKTKLEVDYKAKDGILRILFIYPHSNDIKPQVRNNDVIFILSEEYSPELLDENEWSIL